MTQKLVRNGQIPNNLGFDHESSVLLQLGTVAAVGGSSLDPLKLERVSQTT